MPTTTEPKTKQLDPNDFYFAQRTAAELLLSVSDPTLPQRVANLMQYAFERESMRVELLLDLLDKLKNDLDRAKVFAFALGMWGFLPRFKETGDEPIALGISNTVVHYWTEQYQGDLEALFANLEGKTLIDAATRILEVLNQPVFLEKNGQPRLALLTLLFSMGDFVPYWQSEAEIIDNAVYNEAAKEIKIGPPLISLVVRRNENPVRLAVHVRQLMNDPALSEPQKDLVLAAAFLAVSGQSAVKGAEKMLTLGHLLGVLEGHVAGHECANDDQDGQKDTKQAD